MPTIEVLTYFSSSSDICFPYNNALYIVIPFSGSQRCLCANKMLYDPYTDYHNLELIQHNFLYIF